MKIIVAGDFCPKGRVEAGGSNGTIEVASPQIKAIISDADYSIVNLECPIADGHDKPISKKGPNLKCSEWVLNIIENIGFKCCSLANNHFRDFGDKGCCTTISALDRKSIDYFGGGENLQVARTTLIKEIEGKKIAFINICENEFSIASPTKAGSAPLDLIDNYNQIECARKMADYLILIVHGGHELFQYPSSRMKKTYHWFVDLGVDVVVNHHQHCYSGYEIYKGKPIFYGLGNFCFDGMGKCDSLWTKGYLLELVLKDSISFQLHPYIQCRETPTVIEMNELEKSEFYTTIEKINQIIVDDNKLQETVCAYYNSRISNCEIMMGNMSESRLVRSLKRKSLLPSAVSKEKRNILYDYIFCESHRDVIEYWLNNCDKNEKKSNY